MFKFFKEKVKGALNKFSKKAEEEGEIEEKEEAQTIKEKSKKAEKISPEPASFFEEKREEKKGFFTRIKEKFTKKEEEIIEQIEETFDEEEKEDEEKPLEKESVFDKKIKQEEFEELKKDALEETKDDEEAQKEPEKKSGEQSSTVLSKTRPAREIEEKIKALKEKREKPSAKEPVEETKKEVIEEIKKEPVKPPKEKVQETSEIQKEKFIKTEEKPVEEEKESPKEEQIKEIKEELPLFPEEKEKKGFFKKIKEKITTTKINETKFDELFWDLELAMLENNVAVEVIEKIKNDLKKEIVDQPIQRGKTEEKILTTLKNSIQELFQETSIDLVKKAKEKKPLIICFVGINGSGKTTSIAKITKMLQDNGLSVVLAAADTFRAAAIEQLQTHADKLGAKIIKHDYGADEAAVAYDAIEHAKSKNKDVVLIDTAGRLHSNHNLIDEMKKIIRVSKPDLKIFVGESITGNDCVEQAQKFNEAIEIDGIILSKADIDEKGGAALSISYVTGKPILYLGTGQEYDDLEKFEKEKIVEKLGL